MAKAKKIDRPKKTRAQVQSEAIQAYKDSNYCATIAMCTGSGKTKVGVDIVDETTTEDPDALVIWVTPTEKLRDEGCKAEFEKWSKTNAYEKNVRRYCYASINKLSGLNVKLFIGDEFHNVTENNSEFFLNNNVERVLGLTATPPTDPIKKELLEIIAPVKYEYTLEEGVYDEVVAPFDINVISVNLDRFDKYIQSGNAKKRFYQTEEGKYNYFCKFFEQVKEPYTQAQKEFKSYQEYCIELPHLKDEGKYNDLEKEYKKQGKLYSKATLQRMHFLKNIKSKTKAAEKIIQKIYNEEERFLVFCGSIAQAEYLLDDYVFHSKVKKSNTSYKDFMNGDLNILGVCDAVNEGTNIPLLDKILIVQGSSSILVLTQRIGRVVRFREGHKAQVYILVCKETVDEDWLKKAISGFSKDLITEWTLEEFLNS